MRYLIRFKNHNATAMVEYNEDGFLVKYELEAGDLKEDHLLFISKIFPYNLNRLEKGLKTIPNIDVREIEEDLSFDAFYDKYAHKVSKRSVSEKIWNKMPDIERAKAIKFIDIYDTNIRKTGVNKRYPETYLNSEIWNN